MPSLSTQMVTLTDAPVAANLYPVTMEILHPTIVAYSTADAIRSQGSVRWAAAGETVVLVCAEIRARVLCGIEAFIDVFIAVVRAASPRESVATVTWDRLHPLSTLHEIGTRDVGTSTLVRHAAVAPTDLH